MKKALLTEILLILLCISTPVSAEEVEFDIYDVFYRESLDEAVLMSVDEDVKDAFCEKITEVWENMDTSITLYPDIKIRESDMLELYSMTVYENPRYYYTVKSFSYSLTGDGYVRGLSKLKYTVADKAEVEKTLAEIDKATDEILLYIEPDMTDFEKIMTVHDYMVDNYVYDITDSDQTFLILLDKKGVCAAYSEAFQHMMNVLGIESTLVRSDSMGHIWNMVKLDGEWYHIDVTWDDPVINRVAKVSHRYALLSDSAIAAEGHFGFAAPYGADSALYDAAPWRDDEGAIVTIDGVMYRVEGNTLIDEKNNVIYENLDGGDGKWTIGGGYIFRGAVYTELCKIDGILYFNTDEEIKAYDPKTGKIDTVLEKSGICGIYADKNLLVYNKYDNTQGIFVKSGEIRICDMIMAEPYMEDESAVVRLYNDYDCPLWIISQGDGYMLRRVEAGDIGSARFDRGKKQTILIWKDNMEPVTEKVTVSE